MPSVVHVALDMLMVQAYKSHHGVRLMAENGQSEDVAVLTRRIMELAVQAAYIGSDDDEATRVARAGHYLANLWREAPPELRARLPQAAIAQWELIWKEHSPTLPKRGWAPQFKAIFELLGQTELYRVDYAFLSRIAHGSTEAAIIHYSQPTVDVRSTTSLTPLLTFANRYYLGLAHVWDDQFHLVDQAAYLLNIEPLLADLSSPDSAPEE